MREIKFRAWDKMIKELRYAIEIPSDYFERNGLCDLLNMFQNLSARYEFMQFTGLTDRNGKEIYEGDIVRNGYGLVYPITIEDTHGYRFIFGKDQLTAYDGQSGEVVGNIYQNPELLKEDHV